MKKTVLLILMLLVAAGNVAAQDVRSFLSYSLEAHPQSRLLDLYKSCFQDYMGPEHLISDYERVENYLEEELKTIRLEDLETWLYEPCGTEGRYVRVSLRAVLEGRVPAGSLLDAFVRSADARQRPSLRSWKRRWHKIDRVIRKSHLQLHDEEQDRKILEGLLSEGKYAISHSQEYRDAYHPHYRIVERTIFEKELKPLLDEASPGAGEYLSR